jgi:hypothetical protein
VAQAGLDLCCVCMRLGFADCVRACVRRWASALLAADPDLSALRFFVVPAAVPEHIFWRRYWRLAWSRLREASLASLSLELPQPEQQQHAGPAVELAAVAATVAAVAPVAAAVDVSIPVGGGGETASSSD